MDELLAKVKLSLRIMTDDFDSEITDLINACILDLGIGGVDYINMDDALIIRAVTTYCKYHFGDIEGVEMLERLKQSYDEQKAQLSMATGYTNWLRDE